MIHVAMKLLQIFTFLASLFVGLLIFGNDNYDVSFSHLFVGFIALAISIVRIISLFGTEEE